MKVVIFGVQNIKARPFIKINISTWRPILTYNRQRPSRCIYIYIYILCVCASRFMKNYKTSIVFFIFHSMFETSKIWDSSLIYTFMLHLVLKAKGSFFKTVCVTAFPSNNCSWPDTWRHSDVIFSQPIRVSEFFFGQNMPSGSAGEYWIKLWQSVSNFGRYRGKTRAPLSGKSC